MRILENKSNLSVLDVLFLNNFNRKQKNFYYMEKRLRISRKSACAMMQNAENVDPDVMSFQCDE